MLAMDVMTTNVITVDPDMSVQAVAQLLSERGFSGVPVVDAADRLVGIVSEGDLLHRVETGTERRPERLTGRRRSWWLDTIASDRELARDYVKSYGRTAKDVMTRDVISVTDTTELADVAMLFETKRIKRVPVLRDGKLVGIVSRANLVRALAVTKGEAATDADSDDRTIRGKLLAELKGQKWFKAQEWSKIWAADIIVRGGVVHFWVCDDQSEEERRALRIAAENITGVRRVEEHIVPASYLRASPGRW
jgi:CBS domain-containing protein